MRKSLVFVWIIGMLSVFLVGAEETVLATGRVADAQNNPLPEVEITLKNKASGKEFFAKTNANGIFSIGGIRPGDYLLVVRKAKLPPLAMEWTCPSPIPVTGKVEIPAVILAITGPTATPSPQLLKDFQQVVERMKRDDYIGAIAVLKKMAEFLPQDGDLWYMLGVAYNRENLFVEALHALKRAVEIKPASAGVHYQMGLAYHQLNQIQSALQCYQNALKLAPDQAEIHYNVGVLIFQSNRPMEALLHFNAILRTTPKDVNALDMAARCQIQLQQYAQAKENLELALRQKVNKEKRVEMGKILTLLKQRETH